MICQLTSRSKVREIQRVRLASARGRLFQSPLYSSRLNTTGFRPRKRNSRAKEVLTSPPQSPAGLWVRTSRVAPSLYQSFFPKYLYPLASPTRSTP